MMRVAITGLGMVCPVGVDRASAWAALREGASGIGPIRRFDASGLAVQLAGEVKDQGSAGFGVITQLPRSVFDAVRNFTGFGDSHDRAATPEFTPSTLPPAER